jgi:ribonuclease E
MTKRMLIDAAHPDETRVVMLDHDLVYDYDFVTSSKAQNKGNIYLAKITRVEPSLQAAFVEYGGGKQGFLPFSEIHPDYYQLPADDKQKLLEEQIAEAEAEEAAEDEAFEREQAARESRRHHRGSSNNDLENDNEDDLITEDDSALVTSDPQPSSETVVAINDVIAADSALVSSMGDLPAVEVDGAYTTPTSAAAPYAVQPLTAENFVTKSSIFNETLPEEMPAVDAANLENSSPEDATSSEATTAEDSEEARSRNNRSGRAGFHRRYRIQEVIKRNQIVLVQVIKEERGNKGCSLTTYISLAGRAAVLMPNSPKGGGISRKITDRETRRRLKEVASEMRTHRGMSVIIRTAGIDRTKSEIRRDYEYLVKLWNQIREQTLASTAPALIYEEGNLVKRSLRDLYTSDVEEIIIEGEPAFTEAKEFMRMLMPSHAARVKLYKESMPIFSYAGVEDQLASMTEPQVRLPSGGYLVIHPTEALISIDVNSGRSTTERNVEETAIKTNMEAAAEIGRQLRLRDLAGLIVIDFIDMGYGKNRKSVERAMKDALRADRAKIQLGRISMFGLMELSRQRLRPSIAEAMGVMCPHCRGTGYIHSVETVGIQIIRALEKEASSGDYAVLRVTTHPDAALYLLNEKRAAIQSLESRYNVSVAVLMDAAMITGNHKLIKVTSDGKEIQHVVASDDGKRSRGRGRRGGSTGGRGRSGRETGNTISFEGAVEASTEEAYVDTNLPDDDEVIGVIPREENAEFSRREPRERSERSERGGKRERGGRNRNRNRTDRPDRTPRDPAQVADAVALQDNEAEVAPALDEHGQPIPRERGDRNNRRRGRRGGRGRNRNGRSRFEEGSIGNPVASGEGDASIAYDEAAPAPRRDIPAAYPSAPYEAPAPARTPHVIPLSEKQTNPNAIASPIISESGDDANKTKRKGWWSRVLEN